MPDKPQALKTKQAVRHFFSDDQWLNFFFIEQDLFSQYTRETVSVEDGQYALKSAYRDGKLHALKELSKLREAYKNYNPDKEVKDDGRKSKPTRKSSK